eukprot:1157108-Pelagomonas_calceolata.AAC.11
MSRNISGMPGVQVVIQLYLCFKLYTIWHSAHTHGKRQDWHADISSMPEGVQVVIQQCLYFVINPFSSHPRT